jgi:hypothetical protein
MITADDVNGHGLKLLEGGKLRKIIAEQVIYTLAFFSKNWFYFIIYLILLKRKNLKPLILNLNVSHEQDI